jgi:hypothetical protein
VGREEVLGSSFCLILPGPGLFKSVWGREEVLGSHSV